MGGANLAWTKTEFYVDYFLFSLTPLHGGHVGLLSTAGTLNGIFGQGQSWHIAHWQSAKVTDKTEEQNEDGTLTIREKERFANELTLAFANGRVTTVK
jgi:hypothetical protein